MAPISKRVRAVTPSPTLEISETVTELRSAGVHVHDLGLGEADYPAPRAACEALAELALGGMSHYTPAQGHNELRCAVSRWLNRMFYHQTSGAEYVPSYGPGDIVVSVGSKHLQYSSVLALCNPGDEVIVISPYWVSYPDVIRLAGATPVVVPTHAEEGFLPPIERIAAAITDRTRLIFLNSPSNPTGQVWPHEHINALCELVLSHDDLYVLSDEIYGELLFGESVHISPVTHSERMRRRTILSTGLSKAYSMGGWRIGYAAIADAALMSAVRKVGANTISSAPSMTQQAAVHALEARGRVSEMRVDFERRAKHLVDRLNNMGLDTLPPQGAFYAFADVSSLFGAKIAGRTLETNADVALAMLRDSHVAAVSGRAFGDDHHVRFSYVRTLPELDAACDALEAFVLRHRRSRVATRPVQASPRMQPAPA
ncbi:MAG: pyridoxal phosphate-dependent aminotransferase [Candidatus Krumholzibacteriota bacterium]|nr:pyridoxal phosphate-dependent aminotransferase [Candidatus Krumholzibacteriota bacterium]